MESVATISGEEFRVLRFTIHSLISSVFHCHFHNRRSETSEGTKGPERYASFTYIISLTSSSYFLYSRIPRPSAVTIRIFPALTGFPLHSLAHALGLVSLLLHSNHHHYPLSVAVSRARRVVKRRETSPRCRKGRDMEAITRGTTYDRRLMVQFFTHSTAIFSGSFPTVFHRAKHRRDEWRARWAHSLLSSHPLRSRFTRPRRGSRSGLKGEERES